MALYWEWNAKVGEAIFTDKRFENETHETKVDLYRGNAYLIFIYMNNEDNTYNLYSFFADKEHAKNCLGLSKQYHYGENIFEDDVSMTSITIYKDRYGNKETADLVKLLTQAFSSLDISIRQSPDEA